MPTPTETELEIARSLLQARLSQGPCLRSALQAAADAAGIPRVRIFQVRVALGIRQEMRNGLLWWCFPEDATREPKATPEQMVERRLELREIVEEQKPITVRGTFYQAEGRRMFGIDKKGYGKVQAQLLRMRRDASLPEDESIPHEWIIDHTRQVRRPYSFASPITAIEDLIDTYRKNLWHDRDDYVEIWIEKDALVGVVLPVTHEYDVPLMSARGFSSETFINSSAQNMASMSEEAEEAEEILADAARDLDTRSAGRPCYIYHFGDWDWYGVKAAEKIEEGLRRLAPNVDLYFERAALNEQQIHDWNVPTRDVLTARDIARWGPDAAELDAIPPNRLRALIRECIERHMPRAELERLQAIEEEERNQLRRILDQWLNHDE